MTESEQTIPFIDYQGRRIVIGYPSGNSIPPDFMTSFIQMMGPTLQTLPGITMGSTNQVSSRIAVNRNLIVENARMIGGTEIMWIDADTKFPMHGIVQLISHDKDIVCATTCARKGGDRNPIGLPLDVASVEKYQQLVKMKQIGMPFMLTKMAVFDKLDESRMCPDRCYFAEPPRWMMRKAGWSIDGVAPLVAEDEYFCWLALKAGFDIWCDMELTMQIGHIGQTVFYVEQNQSVSPKIDVDLGVAEQRIPDQIGE